MSSLFTNFSYSSFLRFVFFQDDVRLDDGDDDALFSIFLVSERFADAVFALQAFAETQDIRFWRRRQRRIRFFILSLSAAAADSTPERRRGGDVDGYDTITLRHAALNL